jgi:hydrogenase/urease accessory protein HupE
VWPFAAHAHLASTGFGPFYDGLTHLAMSPDDILGIVAVSLLAGLLSNRHGRWVLFVLPVAWIAGGGIGLLSNREAELGAWNAVSVLVIGALVAADWKLPLPVVAGLALALGFLHGFLNGLGMGRDANAVLALTGIGSGCFVIVALTAALAVKLRATRARIVVRVAGSWIAAVGLLMLGWAFRADITVGTP